MSKQFSRNLILDVPTADDLFKGQGHERISMLLADLINKHENDNLSIGLEGSWGIGKSSIIQMVEQNLNSKKFISDSKYYIFTFDIWKSQGTELRRSILEDFVNWSIKTFPEKENDLKDIQRDIRYTSKEIETATTPILTLYAIFMLISLPFLPIIYHEVIDLFKSDQVPYWGLFAAFSIYLIVMLLLCPYLDYRRNRDDEPEGSMFNSYRARISKMLVSPKQSLDHKATYRIRETNPTNFEFHFNLNRTLKIVQHDNVRIIFVLDNIDRLPSGQIMSYWSLVRSVISRGEDRKGNAKRRSLKTIVPYDHNLISSAANRRHDNTNGMDHPDIEICKNLTPLSSRDIFSKAFHEVLPVAPPILVDAELFFRKNLISAVNFNVSEDQIFRCYKIFYHLLQFHGRRTTPRQIISFVNDLSKYFVLHQAEIQLPTIAAFLAHRDLLTGDPTVLNDENKLDGQVVEIASDPNLKRNLAAMTFNVHTEVAFQVLLDSQILDAAESQDGDTLEKLSQTVGFDLRVDDVVQSNIGKWISTSKLPTVIDNFSKCFQNFSKERRLRYPTMLISAINEVNEISLGDDRYRQYFSALVFANPTQKDFLVRRFIKLSMIWTNDNFLAESGKQFASFLMYLDELARSYDFLGQLKLELKKYYLNTSDAFLFELAGRINGTDIGLRDFGGVTMKDFEQRNFMGQLMKSPSIATRALVQLQVVKFVTNEDWYSIGSGCLSALKNESVDPGHVIHLLHVVCLSLRFYKPTKCREIWVKGLFESGQFFKNIELGDTGKRTRVYSSAVFIAKKIGLDLESQSEIFYGDSLVPTDGFEEYIRFYEFYNQVKNLSEFPDDPIDKI